MKPALWLLCSLCIASGAFLDRELPLEANFLPSATYTSGRTVSGLDPITVTFTRPVIKLGSDVQEHEDFVVTPGRQTDIHLNPLIFQIYDSGRIIGRVRWITTYIFRFTPSEAYPPNLYFSVSLNPEMSSYDGISLRNLDEVHYYKTSDLWTTISGVESEKALELTDGLWNPHETSSSWECPPDAKVIVSLSDPVDTQKISELLYLESTANLPNGDMNGVSWRTEVVEASNTNVHVFPSGLHTDRSYRIVIPGGHQYHVDQGMQVENTTVASLTGLLRFTFPFSVSSSCYSGLDHEVFDLWLRHGLSDNATIEDITRITHIYQGSQRIPYTLERVNLGTLRIHSNLSPGISSLIRFVPDPEHPILDGFGIPMEFSIAEFLTTELRGFFTQPLPKDEFLLFDKLPPYYQILSRGNNNDGSDREWSEIVDIQNIDDIETTLKEMENYLAKNTFTAEQNQVQQGFDWREFDILRHEITPTEDICGQQDSPDECVTNALFLLRNYDSGRVSHILTAVSDLQVTVVANHEDSWTTWVTRMSTGEPVPNAEVTLYRLNTTVSDEDGQIVSQTLEMTDEEGLVEFDVSRARYDNLIQWPFGETFHIVVNDGTDWSFLPDVEFARELHNRPDNIQFVTDRSLYSPGDTIYLKGYVRRAEAGVLIIPDQTENNNLKEFLRVTVESSQDRFYDGTLGWSPDFGSFSAEILIPDSANLGDGEIEVFYAADINLGLGRKEILISTPRTPTAELSLTSSDNIYALGRNMINLEVSTQSYTGTAVEGSVVELSYTIEYVDAVTVCGEERDSVYETFSMTTGNGGRATKEFVIDGYELTEGDIIEFTAEWIDATGALIQDQLSISVAISELSLKIEPSLDDPLPEYDFGFYVSAFEFSGNAIFGTAVNIELLENVYDEFDEISDTLEIATCEAVTNDGITSQCSFSLPEAKEYTARASFEDSYGEMVVATLILGRAANSWAEQPLIGFDGLNIKFDKSEYSFGETVTMRFQNPFSSVWMLLMWGDEDHTRHMLTSVQGVGMQEVKFALGTECLGKCDLVVTASVGRQEKLPKNFPISALYDIEAPRIIIRAFELSVPFEDRTLGIDVHVPQRSRPGEQVNITINVDTDTDKRFSSEVEISVVAVEQVYLDLEPNPVRHFDQEFIEYALGEFYAQTNMYYFVNSRSLQATIDKFLSRLEVDPWIVPDWDISPRFGADVDMTEETFWAQYIDKITDFPLYDFDFYRTVYCEEAKLSLLSRTEEAPEVKGPDLQDNPVHNPQGHTEHSTYLQLLQGLDVDDCCICVGSEEGEVDVADERFGASRGSGQDGPLGPDGEDGAPGRSGQNGGPGGTASRGRDGDDDSGDSRSTTTPQIPPGPAFEPRTLFEITPLFIGREIVRPGETTITLDLPDNVGTFNIRAYGVDDLSRFGVAETEIVVTKPITMQPSQPRFARVGDESNIGVTVTADMANFVGDVTVNIDIEGPRDLDAKDFAVLQSNASVTEELTGGAPVEVSFPVVFTGIGEPRFSFSAITEGGVDAMMSPLDVLNVMDNIDVATSFSLISTPEGTFWDEDITLPQTYTDLRFGTNESNYQDALLKTDATVAHLKKIRVNAERLLAHFEDTRNNAERYYGNILHDAADAEFWLSLVAAEAAFDAYPPQPDSDDVRSRINAVQDEATEALTNLTDLTWGLMDKTGSFTYRSESQRESWWDYIDYKLNAFGLYVDMRSGNSIPSELTDIWRTKVETFIVDSARDQLCNGFSTWSALSFTFAALGIDWTPPDNSFRILDISLEGETYQDIRYELSVENAQLHLTNMNEMDRAMFLYAFFSSETDERFDSSPSLNAIQELYNDVIVDTAETAYLSYHSTDETAVALSAIVHSPPEYSEDFILEKIANWVDQQDQYINNNYNDPIEISHEMFGLMDYDVIRTSHNPNILYTVKGDHELASNVFTFATQDAYRASIPWSDFTVNGELKTPLQFSAHGNGEVSVYVALEYLPPIYQFPVFRGFFVERFCQKFDPATKTGTGEPIVLIQEGEVVQMTIQVSVIDRANNIQILDYIPAGLEPLDPALFEIEDDDDPMGWFYNVFSGFQTPELAVDRVSWYSDGYVEGTHSVTYHALAVTPGIYIWPQARAFITTHPETIGMSGGGYFVVTKDKVADEDVQDFLISLDLPYIDVSTEPLECREDCGNSVCDLGTGTCVVFDNFIR